MVTMSNSDFRDRNRTRGSRPSGVTPDDEVPVHGTRKSSLVMVPIAIFMCLAQTSFAAARYGSSDPQFLWFMFSTLVAIPSGLLLLARDRHPEAVFWGSCALVIAFPFDSMLALMAMTSLLARRSSRAVTVRAIAALVGLHLRSKAIAASAEAKADAAANQAHTLQANLNNQQLADAIAAEAHDTLAHSLSLLALNASALQAESDKLCTMTQSSEDAVRTHADSIAQQAQQIRRQAAGALDEAHTIIDMLRHPDQAYVQLAPSDDTALTRESLNELITDARQAGMRVDTWIDIQQLSKLDENLGKIAYGADERGVFHIDARLPWIRNGAEQQPNVAGLA